MVGGCLPGSAAAEIVARLWRHSVAVSIAARSLARDAGDPGPSSRCPCGSALPPGMLGCRGVDPDWVLRWWQDETRDVRRRREIADLGAEIDDLGRRLAERWGCDPLVIDAVWLHADRGGAFRQAASQPERLAYIQEACHWVEQTPWSLGGPSRNAMPSEPRLRILVAEVQARCGGAFDASDATPHEEKLTRQNARLRLRLANERAARSRSDRFLETLGRVRARLNHPKNGPRVPHWVGALCPKSAGLAFFGWTPSPAPL